MQTTIFDPPPTALHNGSPTSRIAAQLAAPTAGTKRAIVLDAIKQLGGATIDELSEATGMLTASVCARSAELKAAGLIRDSGRTRLTRSKRPADVLEAAP